MNTPFNENKMSEGNPFGELADSANRLAMGHEPMGMLDREAMSEQYAGPANPQPPMGQYGGPMNPQPPMGQYGSSANPQPPMGQYGGPANPQPSMGQYGDPMNPQPQKISKPRFLWEILSPGLIFLAGSLVAGMIVGAIVGMSTFLSGEGSYMDAVSKAALLSSLIGFLIVLVFMLLLFRRDNTRFGKQVPRWNAVNSILSAVIVCGFAILGNVLIAALKLNEIFPGYEEMSELLFSGQNPVLLFLTVAIVGPIAEELTFRGLTQRRAIQFTNPWVGILIASFLFGLYHMNMVQFLYAFPLGILLGVFYHKSQNIVVPILGHVAANGLVLILSGILPGG